MLPTYVELQDVEVKIVDLTVSDDHPEFSVRMPLVKMVDLHDTEYLELRYNTAGTAPGIYVRTMPSPGLMARMIDADKAMAALPVGMERDVVPPGGLGMPDHVHIAAQKLAEFHKQGGYRALFAKYGK